MSQSVAAGPGAMTPELHLVLADLQSLGVRVERDALTEARSGGAGPSGAGMMWVEGIPITFPHSSGFVSSSPFSIRKEEDGWGLYRQSERLAAVTLAEVALAARDLDGAVDVTLTTGTTRGPGRGALYMEDVPPPSADEPESVARMRGPAAGLLITGASLPGVENALGTWGTPRGRSSRAAAPIST